jgi:hypothetical protein
MLLRSPLHVSERGKKFALVNLRPSSPHLSVAHRAVTPYSNVRTKQRLAQPRPSLNSRAQSE